MNNVARHAGTTEAWLTAVGDGDGGVTVVVADQGVGFDPSSTAMRSRRLGLTSMEERAAALGGSFEVVSAAGAGTRVRLEVPAE